MRKISAIWPSAVSFSVRQIINMQLFQEHVQVGEKGMETPVGNGVMIL